MTVSSDIQSTSLGSVPLILFLTVFVSATLLIAPSVGLVQSATSEVNAPVVETVEPGSDRVDIPVPSDPTAKAAFDVLEKHCARCHQDGRLEERLGLPFGAASYHAINNAKNIGRPALYRATIAP